MIEVFGIDNNNKIVIVVIVVQLVQHWLFMLVEKTWRELEMSFSVLFTP